MQGVKFFPNHNWMIAISKYRFPIAMTIGFRLALSIWLALVWIIVDRHIQLTSEMVSEIYGRLQPASSLFERALIDVWLRWDAVHLMNIAVEGYSGVGVGELNYPPLYPYLVLLFKPLAFGNETLSGLMLSTLFCLLAFILLYFFVLETFQDPALARQTILALSVYPTSFFLFAPYTDSLFLALSIGFFLLIKRRRWIFASLLVILATLTRFQAVLLVVPLAIEAWRTKSIILSRSSLIPLLSIGFAPTGYLLFAVWRRSIGVPDLSASFREYSNIIFVDPLTGLWLAIKQALVTRELLVISEVLSVLLFLALLLWMFSQSKYRSHWPLLLYSLTLIILFMTKHSTVASAMQSSNRYVLGIFPAFIGLAEIVSNLSPKKRSIFLLISTALLIMTSAAYAIFIFIG